MGKDLATAIYYDLDDVRREDVLRARSAAAAGAMELVSEGTSWPEGVPGEGRLCLTGLRDDGFRNDLMAWIERLRLELDEVGPGWRRHGISLFEVARYRLLFDIAPWEHRWRVVCEIKEKWAPSALLWVCRPSRLSELRDMEVLAGDASTAGLRMSTLPVPRTNPSVRSAKDKVNELVRFPVQRVLRACVAFRGKAQMAANGGRRQIVFTEYFPNSVKASIPVAEELARRYGAEVLWLTGRKEVQDVLDDRGIPSLGIAELAGPKAVLRGVLTPHERHELRKAVRRLPARAFDGGCLAGTGQRYRLRGVERLLAAAFDEAAHWVEAYHDALGRIRPIALVSSTYSSVPGRAAALATRAHGGRSVYIQHGRYPDQYVWSFFCHDLKLMWGEYHRRSLERFGHDPDSVIATGATTYDELSARVRSHQRRTVLGGDGPLRIAFMASRTGGMRSSVAVSRATLQAVAETGLALPAQVTVKKHPGDATSVPEEVLRAYPETKLLKNGNSQDVILESDLVIVCSSTTGFEACVTDRPLIVLDLTGSDDQSEYDEFGAAIRVTRPEDLTQNIRRLQGDQALQRSLAQGRRRLLEHFLNGARGNATELAASAIMDLAKGDTGRPVSLKGDGRFSEDRMVS